MKRQRLNFNREKAREHYLSTNPYLKNDPRKLELLLLRGDLLARNQDFIREYLSASDEYELCHRWGVNSKGFYMLFHAGSSVRKVGGNRDEGTVTVEIDLLQSKKKILEDFNQILMEWKGNLQEEIEDAKHSLDAGRFPHWWAPEFDDEPPRFLEEKKGTRYVKSDIEDYNCALAVWDLRNEGKSWNQIRQILKLNDTQTARNWYKKIEELIQAGIPGLKAFPC